MLLRVNGNGNMCPKRSPKLILKSTPNRSKIEVLGQCLPPGLRNVDLGGSGVDFRVFGGTAREPKSTENPQNGVAHGRHRDRQKTLGTWSHLPQRNERSQQNSLFPIAPDICEIVFHARMKNNCWLTILNAMTIMKKNNGEKHAHTNDFWPISIIRVGGMRRQPGKLIYVMHHMFYIFWILEPLICFKMIIEVLGSRI